MIRLFFVVACALVLNINVALAWFEKDVVDGTCYDKVSADINISRADIKQYKKAFEYIRKGDVKSTDKAIKDIKNDVLMGHVLAQKYLSKEYVPTYEELRVWLEKYSDHPQAPRLFALASRRGDVSLLSDPLDGRKYYSPYEWYNVDYEKLAPNDAKYIRQQVNKFRKAINSGKTRAAKAVLEDKKFRKAIPNKYYDDMSGTLALVYFLDNENKLVLTWVDKAVKRSSDNVAAWIGGLASYRTKDYKKATYYFSHLGDKTKGDQWLISSGAFWAYRSYDALKDDKNAQKWLKVAAIYERTFYGVLANQKLGRKVNYVWDSKTYLNDFSNYDYVGDILSSPSMKRSIILVKAKNDELAERDLRYNHKGMTEKQQEIALYMSKQYEMRSLGIVLSNCLLDYSQNRHYDAIAYPSPDWSPRGGWLADKALVLALVRQESAFHPSAVSGAGARGLMQLMPRTVLHIRNNTGISNKGVDLDDVEYNLQMGQSYVNYLLAKPFINGNLFFLTVAYNAGPGNLLKWQKKQKYNDDPLMYIETVPARETRLYIKRVITNFWIYKMRFDEKNKTLEQVADGEWPILPLDD